MRLEDLTPAHVRRAVAIYMKIAWEKSSNPRPRFDPVTLQGLETMTEVFELCEQPREEERGDARGARYMMRLGNDTYPFMKLVMQEYLVDREYFFSVDTHDEHFTVPEDDPEAEAWEDLRRHNRELKAAIEGAWAEADLPTHRALKSLAEGLAEIEREGSKAKRLLLVDDEKDVCQGLGALLEARGYQVELAYDGQEVMDRLLQAPQPDLVVLDFSMPELDGAEVLRRIKAQSSLTDLPVLLATASSIDLARVPRATGLLRKPYPREVLFAMIEKLLQD